MMRKEFQAGTKEYYREEVRRMQESQLPDDVKAKIQAFLNHFQHSEQELSFNRLRFHTSNLRIFFTGMANLGIADKILNPSSEDIESGFAFQRNRTPYGRAEGEISEWTLEGYKATLKKFYKWLGKPEPVKDIKYKTKVNYKRKPDFIISQEQVDLLVQAADNSRDKAIISMFYDTGIRVGELMTLTIKDVEFDDYGMQLVVSGKTGVRKVRAIGDSVGYTKEWMNVHPDPFNSRAWLFCGIGHDMRGKSNLKESMSHAQIYEMLRKIKARAIKLGFPADVKVNPHKFRHNRASQLAPKISESILERTMGWVPASKMSKIYVHLDNEAVDNAILEANGIKKEKKLPEMRKSRMCLRCKTLNPANHKFCLQCGRPLDYDELELLEQREGQAVGTLKESDLIGSSDKDLLSELSEDPELQSEMLLMILKKLKGQGKFDELRKLMDNDENPQH